MMVVYIKCKGKLKTIQDLALEHKLPISLIYSRYYRGIRDYEQLTEAKYESYQRKNDNCAPQ